MVSVSPARGHVGDLQGARVTLCCVSLLSETESFCLLIQPLQNHREGALQEPREGPADQSQCEPGRRAELLRKTTASFINTSSHQDPESLSSHDHQDWKKSSRGAGTRGRRCLTAVSDSSGTVVGRQNNQTEAKVSV